LNIEEAGKEAAHLRSYFSSMSTSSHGLSEAATLQAHHNG